jgi:hypothetical protein
MDLRERITNWVEETALKILTTPYFATGTVSDGEDVDRTGPAGYVSFNQWLECTVDMILRRLGDPNSEEDKKSFNPVYVVESAFPVLASLQDNSSIVCPLADTLMEAIGESMSET